MTTAAGLVGLNDNSNGFGAYRSKRFTLAAGESYQFTLLNYNKTTSGTDEWENWTVEATDGSKYLDFRADGGYWGALPSAANYSGNTWSNISSTKTTWLAAYNGVTVTLTVSRSSDGTSFVVEHSATTNTVSEAASQTYAGTYTATISAEATINFYLTNEDSHFIIKSVNYNGTQLNYASSESAYVDQANSTTSYDGASVDNLRIYYTQFRDWGSSDGTVKVNTAGKIAFYKFDLTDIKSKLATDGGTITGVTFSVFGNGDSGKCSKVRILGYNHDWSSSSLTNSTITNNAGTIEGTVTSTGSFQPLNTTTEMELEAGGNTLEADALTYVNSAIAAGKDYVTIALTANYTRTGLLKTYANLSFSYSAEVLYEASFNEKNSLDPAITIYSDNERTIEVAKNELAANTTYYYTAKLAGYEDYNGSFDVTTSNPVVDFTMTALPRYTFTVNAVNSEGGAVIKTLFTDDDSYDGKTYNVYYPAYLTTTGNVVTYSKDNSTYWQNLTSTSGDATKTVSYTAYTGTAWFYEGEEIDGATTYTTATFAGRSSNGATGVLSAKTVATLDAGSYTISARVIGKANNTCSIYKTSTSGEQIMSLTTNTTGVTNVANITLDAATEIVADGGYYTTSDNGFGFDYILIEKVTSVTATIASSGYSTIASEYALDCANLPSGLKAYKVTGATKTAVNIEEVTVAVAAGTGLILEGTAGQTYSIPVAVSGSDLSATNKLKAAVTATNVAANEAYILQGGLFHLVTEASTVPAGKAYLLATDVPASVRALDMVVDGNADGITAIDNAQSAGNAMFDLSGRRVAKAQKGIYIVNGKKVVK